MRWGEGKREVELLRGAIIAHLADGHPVKRIHETLTTEGRLTIGLRPFYRYVNQIRSESLNGGAGPAPSPAGSLSPAAKRGPSQKSAEVPPARSGLPRGELVVRIPHDDRPPGRVTAEHWFGDEPAPGGDSHDEKRKEPE